MKKFRESTVPRLADARWLARLCDTETGDHIGKMAVDSRMQMVGVVVRCLLLSMREHLGEVDWDASP